MRQNIFTRLARLVGVAQPQAAETPSTGSSTPASVRRTSTDKGSRIESGCYMGNRQTYSAVHGPGSREAATQVMGIRTSTPGSHAMGVQRPVNSFLSRNLVPHWDYRSHSTAAACIMITIFAISVLVLLALYFKKVHNFCRRRKRERNNYLHPKYSSYDNPVVLEGEFIPFSTTKVNEDEKTVNPYSIKDTQQSFDSEQSRPTSPGFVVEEDPAIGSVVRIYRAVKNKIPKTPVRDALPTLPALSPPRCGSTRKKQVKNDTSDETMPKVKTCNVEIPLVVVPPAPTRTPSMCASAARETHSSPGDYTYHRGHSDLESSDESNIIRYSDPGPEPSRVSYLPKIYPTGLPLFNLEGLRFD